jgi:hypothetical protein
MMCTVRLLSFIAVIVDKGGGSFLGWDDNCEGSIKTIAREKEWEEHQAQNDAIQWGTSTPGGGWDVTPSASPVPQDGGRRFGPWGLTAKQVAQGGTWLTDEELYAEHCKGNLTDLRRILHLSLAKGNPKLIYKSK